LDYNNYEENSNNSLQNNGNKELISNRNREILKMNFKSNFCENPSMIEVPDFINLIADSAKLNYLDKKLETLKEEGHRVLIFCQMTKMMDILEDYLMRKKYQFFRLDGSCKIFSNFFNQKTLKIYF
jgi:SNF2 family DNA or RNA helicase